MMDYTLPLRIYSPRNQFEGWSRPPPSNQKGREYPKNRFQGSIILYTPCYDVIQKQFQKD
jgi:hypothetical protein